MMQMAKLRNSQKNQLLFPNPALANPNDKYQVSRRVARGGSYNGPRKIYVGSRYP